MPQCRSTIDCVDDTIHATKYNKLCHSAQNTIDCVDDTIHATKYNKPCHSAQNTIDCVDDTIHATDIQINFLNDFKSYSVLKFIGNYSIDTLP